MKIRVNDNFDMNDFIDFPSLIIDYINSYDNIIKDVEDLKNKDIGDNEFYDKFNSIFTIENNISFENEMLYNKYLKFVRENSYSLMDEALGEYNIRFKKNLCYLRNYVINSSNSYKEKIVYLENVIDKIDNVLDNKNDDVKKKVLFC